MTKKIGNAIGFVWIVAMMYAFVYCLLMGS